MSDPPEFGGEEFGLDEDEIAARIKDVESAIAQCMSDAGLEYTPVDVDTIRDAADAGTLGLSDSNFKSQYGYGVATRLGEPKKDVKAQLAVIATSGADPAELTPEEREAVTVLQEYEVAVAVAADECELAHIDDVATEIEVFGEASN